MSEKIKFTLVSIEGDRAVVDLNGRRETLDIGDQMQLEGVSAKIKLTVNVARYGVVKMNISGHDTAQKAGTTEFYVVDFHDYGGYRNAEVVRWKTEDADNWESVE